MLHGYLIMMGYFINFVSGIILDIEGTLFLMVACLVVAVPLYILGEWMDGSLKADSQESEVRMQLFYILLRSHNLQCVILIFF